MKIGSYNRLRVSRFVDFGLYLADADGNEVLLPAKWADERLVVGDEVEVFVYTDGDDRPIATTMHPLAATGQLAMMTVKAVNDTGAFLDWGIEKDLLVPFREQRAPMRQGRSYLVYVYLDDVSGRVAATTKIEKYVGNVLPDYRRWAEVEAVITSRTSLGYKAVVDSLHWGLIYDDELFGREMHPGQRVKAWVRKVRDDGKIDLTLHSPAADRADQLGRRLLARMQQLGGRLDLTDSSAPELISSALGCSKKDFKKAVGHLLKEGKIGKDGPYFKLLTEKR